MDDFYKCLHTFFGLIVDAGSLGWEYIVGYFNFLWRMTKWFALFAAIPIPVLLVCLIFGWHVNWLYCAYRLFVGVEVVILMVLAFPIILAAQIIFDKFPQFASSIKKSVQIIAAVAFWALILAVYFYVVPVWENPKMVPLVLMAAAALAIGSYAGLVRLHFGSAQKIATVSLVGILVFATAAISFPNRMRQIVGFTQSIDITAAQPNRLNISYDDVENGHVAFFRPSDGKPLVWYCETVDGRVELFDKGGYHPIYKEELKQVTPDIVSKIKEQLKKEPIKELVKPTEQLQQVDATRKKQSVETPQNTKTTPQYQPLPVPPQGKRQDIKVNDQVWTILPKSRSGKFRFQSEILSVKFLVKCTNFLPDGTPKDLPIIEFSGETDHCVPLPPCAEIAMKTINTKMATVYWWEE